MYNNKTFLAIIPARGGSKRVPRKNARLMHGKPLISWTIEAAKQCQYIDMTIVSSDDEELLAIAKDMDVTADIRPALLATDTATTFDVIKYIINKYPKFDYIVLLQPTSPLRNANHISEAIEELCRKNADGIISVTKPEINPMWCNTLPEDGSMANFMNNSLINVRSQELSDYYALNGAIYINKTEELLKNGSFFLKANIYAYKMDRKYSFDIDEELDFILCEKLLTILEHSEKTGK